MPLIAPAIKAKFQQTIYNGLKREFSASAAQGKNFPPMADEFWLKLSNAISDIATDLVVEMTTNAKVSPGQVVSGTFAGVGSGPIAGSTVSPGNII